MQTSFFPLFHLPGTRRAIYLFFAALMPCSGQQLAMFMFAHFFLSFFNDTAQKITSQNVNVKIN